LASVGVENAVAAHSSASERMAFTERSPLGK